MSMTEIEQIAAEMDEWADNKIWPRHQHDRVDIKKLAERIRRLATPQPPKDAGAVPLPVMSTMKFDDGSEFKFYTRSDLRVYGDAREAAVRAGAANPAADALEQLRAEQASRVMPLIGPLLDKYVRVHGDDSVNESGIMPYIEAINAAMEGEGCGACGDACNGGPCRLKAESPVAEAEELARFPDTFRGSDAHLVRCIEALLSLDAKNALVPHGIGGHAKGLLSAAMHRLTAAVVNQKLTTDDGYDSDGLVLVPRGLLGAACSAIRQQRHAPNILAKLREYTFAAQKPTAERGVSDAMVEKGDEYWQSQVKSAGAGSNGWNLTLRDSFNMRDLLTAALGGQDA